MQWTREGMATLAALNVLVQELHQIYYYFFFFCLTHTSGLTDLDQLIQELH